MQLDLQQLVSKLEKMVDLRPIPHKALVENYVKAYYLPESALEDWIVRHEVGMSLSVVCTRQMRID